MSQWNNAATKDRACSGSFLPAREPSAVTAADPLAGARAAAARGDWREALDLLDAAGEPAGSAEGLELRAGAAYGAGDFEGSVTAWEDLHALLLSRGDAAEAARAAAMVALFLMIDTGLMSPVRGWLRRAEHLLDGIPEGPTHAIIAMTRAYERLMCGDLEAARANATAAVQLGEMHGVQPAVVVGRTAAARVRILDGDVTGGLELLDEVGAMLMSGAVDALTAGMMYCELICAAQGLAMHDRAREWTEVMERWRHGAAFGGLNGRCRVHRAEMLRTSGPCDLAEEEALAACEELRPWMRREFGWPLTELGNIRLRRGDLAGAEEAYLAAHQHAWSPHPGLALVLLAKGDVEGASAVIADAIAHPANIPSKERPPYGELCLAPLLAAQVEIATAAGDVACARLAASQLEGIAGAFPSRSLAASALLARARVALLDGRYDDAVGDAGAAAEAWAEVGAPFECAESHVVMGEAHRRAGRHDPALVEWRAASAAFTAFGAAWWAEHVAGLIAMLDGGAASAAQSSSPPADVQPATFRCDGDMRTICFGGATVLMRDLKGFRYLERLLSDPGREFHVLDLVAVEQGSLPTGSAHHDLPAARGDAGLPLIDDAARAAYQRRLVDVEDDIAEATRMNDIGRLELAERDREYLMAELASAVGLGGRARTTGGSVERARTSVTRSLRYAIDRLAEHHPSLAAHLDQSVHTGVYCCYSPDPLARVTWTT